MAFYTSRVDDDGNELKRRPSALNLTESTARSNLSSRSCEIIGSVRYVNPAAYIEKSGETERALGAVQKSVRSKGSAVSETQSDIVPPLDLQSEDNYPTAQDCTFSYRKYSEPAKIALKPDSAYKTWLSVKRKLLTDAAAKKKKGELQKKREIDEHKRLARQSRSQPPHQSSIHQISLKETIKSSSTHSDLSEKPTRSQLSDVESKARLAQWEKSKRAQKDSRRVIKRQEEEKRREIQEQRRHIAADVWEKWLSEAAKKPKPVPLNRGIFTLRGST